MDEADANYWSDMSEAHQDLSLSVEDGLGRGDLAPLVEYLRSPFTFDLGIRESLAQFIEGERLYRLECVKNRPGPGSERDELLAFKKKADIFFFYWGRTAGGVHPKQAMADTMAAFHCGRTQVTEARKIFLSGDTIVVGSARKSGKSLD